MALTILNYGKTRSAAKTTQAEYIADYVWRKWRKKTRFVTTDTGSLWEPVQAMVDAGVIDPLFVPTEPRFNSISVMRKLRNGQWPTEYRHGAMDIIQPNGKTKWTEWAAQKDSAEVGAYVFESLHQFGAGGMRDLAEKNTTIGREPVPGYRVEDGEVYASNTMQHYGMMHTELLGWLDALAVLPVEIVYVTSLEDVNEPQDKDLVKVYKIGPLVPGRKITDVVPAHVNICLHSVRVGEELRCYIRPHPWEVLNKYEWPAGLRVPPAMVAEVNKRYPDGYIKLSIGRGLAELLEFRDELREKAKAEAQKRLAVAVDSEKGGK